MATTTKAGATPAKKTAKPAAAAARTIGGVSIKPRAGKKSVAPEQRHSYIEVAAYYIAERRGFSGGSEAEDWAAAEAEIDRLLVDGRLNC